MKKFHGFAVLLGAAIALTLATSTPASAVQFKTVDLKWSTGLDTTFVSGETDSDFVTVDLSDMKYPEYSAGTNAFDVAFVTFTAEVSNGGSDSIYFVPQRGTRIYNNATGAFVTVWDNITAGPAAAAGNCAVTQTGGGGTSNQVFRGVLKADPDLGSPSAVNIWGAKQIRLRVQGDNHGGTAGKLSGVHVSIRYATRDGYAN